MGSGPCINASQIDWHLRRPFDRPGGHSAGLRPAAPIDNRCAGYHPAPLSKAGSRQASLSGLHKLAEPVEQLGGFFGGIGFDGEAQDGFGPGEAQERPVVVFEVQLGAVNLRYFHDRVRGDAAAGSLAQAARNGDAHLGRGGNALFNLIEAAGERIDALAKLGDFLAGPGQHFHHQGAGEDAVFAQNVAADSETAGGFAAQHGVVLDHGGDHVFEAHGDLIASLAEAVRQAVEQVGGREIADHRATLAADLVEIPVEQQEDVVDGDVVAALVDNGDAVGVAVHGKAQIAAVIAHGGGKQAQGVGVGSRRAAAEQRVMALVQEGDAAAGFGENDAERKLADAIHQVDLELEPRLANRLEIDQPLDGIDVFVGEIAPLDEAGPQGGREIEDQDVANREGVGLGFDGAGLLIEQQRAIGPKNFKAVPLRRVVAGGEDQAVGGAAQRGGVGDERSGRVFSEQDGGDLVAGENFGGGLGGLAGKEAAVEADQDAARLRALADDLIGERLRQPADVEQREALADEGPPAASAEGDPVLLFAAVR